MLATVGGSRGQHPGGTSGMDVTGIGLDGEKLPVVELKPFTQKEWRPANSRRIASERPPSAISNPLPLNSTRSYDFESYGYIDPNKNPGAVTPRGMDAPCPRANMTGGEKMLSHPKHRIDNILPTPNLPCSQQGMLQAFITKLDREKSTVDEIKTGHSQAAHFSCAKRPRERDDVEFQYRQTINVQGRKLANPPRTSAIYYSPWEYYSLTRSFHDLSRSGGQGKTEDKASSGDLTNLYAQIEQMHNVYLDENIYDNFDRSSTLPSIQVNRAALRKRLAQPASDPGQGIRDRTGSSRSSDMHRLGVTNTLDLLSHYGQPSGVEQHLSDHLKTTLDNIRRSKPFGYSGAYRSTKNYDFSPTAGEQSLSTGKRANTRSQPRTSTSSITGISSTRGGPRGGSFGWLSRATTYLDSGAESLAGVVAPVHPLDGKTSRNASRGKRNKSGQSQENSVHDIEVKVGKQSVTSTDRSSLRISPEAIALKSGKADSLRERQQMTSIDEQEKEGNSSKETTQSKQGCHDNGGAEDVVGREEEVAKQPVDSGGASGQPGRDGKENDQAHRADQDKDEMNDDEAGEESHRTDAADTATAAAAAASSCHGDEDDDGAGDLATGDGNKIQAEDEEVGSRSEAAQGPPQDPHPDDDLADNLPQSGESLPEEFPDEVRHRPELPEDDSSDDSSVSHAEDEDLQLMLGEVDPQIDLVQSNANNLHGNKTELAF